MNTHVSVLTLDHLQQDEELPISWTLDPSFLDLAPNDEVQPTRSVVVKGTYSSVGEYVMFEVSMQAFFSLPCALCNERFEYEVCIGKFRHQELAENIKQKKWDIGELLREVLLLELPFFPQCGGKQCLHHEEVQRYFSKGTSEKEGETKNPFQDFFEK